MTPPTQDRSPIKHEPFLHTVAKYASSRLYRQVLGVVTAYLRPKLLSPEQYGLWTLLGVIPGYAAYLHLGAQHSMRFLIPYYKSLDDTTRVTTMKETVFSASLCLTGLASIVLLLAALLPNLSMDVRLGLATMAIFIILQCIQEYYISLLKADERFPLLARSFYVQTTVSFVFTVVLLLLFKLHGLYLSILLTFTVIVFFLRANYSAGIRLSFRYSVFRELVVRGFPIMVADLAVELLSTSDRLVISGLLGRREMGYYGIATIVFGFLLQIPGTTREIMEPRMMRQVAHHGEDEITAEYLLKPIVNTAYLLPFLIGPVFFGLPVLIPLVLPRYSPAIVPTQILVFGIYFMALSYAPRMFIVARNWQKASAMLLPVVLLANVSLSVTLVKTGFGLAGVAFSSGVSFFLLFLTLFGLVMVRIKPTGSHWRRHLAGIAIPFPTMILAILLLARFVPAVVPNPYLGCGVSIIVFWGTMLGLHAIARRQLPLLRGIEI